MDSVATIPFTIEGRIIKGQEAQASIDALQPDFQKVIHENDYECVEIYFGVKAERHGRKLRYIGNDPMIVYWIGYNHRDSILRDSEVYTSWYKMGDWVEE